MAYKILNMKDKIKYVIQGIITLIVLILVGSFVTNQFKDISWLSGVSKGIFFLLGVCVVLWTVVVAYENNPNEASVGLNAIKKLRSIIIFIIAFSIVGGIILQLTRKLPSIYNKSVVYNKQYQQKTQELPGYYDKMWKTYKQKKEIAVDLNKETFIEVTKIIMEGRKDGQAVTWKWLTENQQIPYSEFTKFYSDLSNFIESQREGYYSIEKERQYIATAHNMLIDTFPNNLYNKILGIKKINYSYGFLSDSTNKVFSSGKENLK